LHQGNAVGGSFEADAACVVSGVAANEPGALQAGDDAAHGGGADLLGGGQFAEGFRPAENEYRKSRKLGGSDSAGEIADTQAAEKVDGGGMELVGDAEGVRIFGDSVFAIHGFAFSPSGGSV
jgi:hypothetical protein